MKCLLKYQWVKLPRNQLPPGKGVMGAWARLASRVAFRNGQAVYCGHVNQVSLGTWSGGVVGLKSILGIKNRQKALETLDKLSALGYLTYELDGQTKKLTYQIKDWVVHCSGAPCMGDEAVYATPGYGFLCLPGTSPSVSRRRTINSMSRTHGWTCGATRYGRTPAMRFLIRRRPSSMGSRAPF